MAVPLLLGACAGPSLWVPMPQSNFTYPNSNVIPLRHAEASASQSYILPFQVPIIQDASQTEDLLNRALQSGGGDLLIDGSVKTDTKTIPLGFISIYTVTQTIEGTSAKMEIGKRTLK